MKHSSINFNIFLFIILIIASSCSRLSVSRLSYAEVGKKHQGFYYYLPQTVITVDVDVKKIDKIKGPLSAYASKYLGISNVISSNTSYFEVGNIKINSVAEPDTANIFFVNLKKYARLGHYNKLIAQLTENGMLVGVNESTVFVDSDCLKQKHNESTINNVSGLSLIPVSTNLFEKIDTIIEKINVDTTIIERKILRKTMVEKSLEQKAKDASDLILKVKESKFNLISGYSEVNYSKETLSYMLSKLDSLEQEYLSLFTGITNTQVITYRFNFVPRPEIGVIPAPLFWFSSVTGITDSSSEDCDPYYIIVQRKGTTRTLGDFLKAGANDEKDKQGFYYRIPEYAQVVISEDNRIRTSSPILINQFGVVTSLPQKVRRLQFYNNYGSLRKLELSKKEK